MIKAQMIPDVAFCNTMNNVFPTPLKHHHRFDWMDLFYALKRFIALYPWLHLTGPYSKAKCCF